jgi:hypothetical protein
MRNFVVSLLLVFSSVLTAQTDTVLLPEPWSRLKFDTTELWVSTAIIGKPTSTTYPMMAVESAKNANGEAFSVTKYYHRLWIDSLRTMFVFSSEKVDAQDSTLFTGMELYGRFPEAINGTIRIDKSFRRDVKKIFGEPDMKGGDYELNLERYRLFVNNAWCQVDFYYDVNGLLRKVFIEKK